MNSNQNFNKLWDENNSTFNVGSPAVESQGTQPSEAGHVVPEHLGSRLSALKNKPSNEEAQASTVAAFEPPKESTIPQNINKTEGVSFEGISLDNSTEVTPPTTESSTSQRQEKIQATEEVQTTNTVEKKPVAEEASLVDPSKEFDQIEQTNIRMFEGFANRITGFFKVDDGSKNIKKTGKKGGVTVGDLETKLNESRK